MSGAKPPVPHVSSWFGGSVLLEKLTVPQLIKNLLVIYETQNSFPCSQELTTGPCLEPDQSNSHSRIQSGLLIQVPHQFPAIQFSPNSCHMPERTVMVEGYEWFCY